MLQRLFVSNYALIDHLDLSFNSGFSVITGETGSGKSIMLGALSLVLGERADTKSLRQADKKCIIEAEFRLNESFRFFFEQHDLDYELETTIRREITPSGKSRAFINDTPANLNQLKTLGERLVDIHSQHQTLKIKEESFQLKIIDAFAQNEDLLSKYGVVFQEYQKELKALDALKAQIAKSKADYDYLLFQLEELKSSQLDGMDLEALEKELELLSNAEEIKQIASDVTSGLLSSSDSIVDRLSAIKAELSKLGNIHPDFQEHADRLNSAFIEIKDISEELDAVQESLEHNPERIIELTDWVNSANRLLTKHHVGTIQELVGLRDSLEERVNLVSHADEDLGKQQNKVDTLLIQLKKVGKELSANRNKSIPPLQERLGEILTRVNMPDCTFRIGLNELEVPSSNGIDRITFEVQTNKGSQFLPVHKSASGGELSRMMFALKLILSADRSLQTIIFDEIDTGVSGEVAAQMGVLMQEMGQNMQVISISHLPQIAGKGSSHYKVSKEVVENGTITQVHLLSRDERMVEIATMLSGQNPTEAALNNARELLN